MRPSTAVAAAALVVLATIPSEAQPAPEVSGDPLVAVRDADPLELARVARRLGDEGVLARLAEDRPVVVRLAAIRATPWLRAPETALRPLADIAAGRDSWLAPEAARVALRIARELTPDRLASRETGVVELAPARAELSALAADDRARADIRRAAEVAADALRAVGVPDTE